MNFAKRVSRIRLLLGAIALALVIVGIALVVRPAEASGPTDLNGNRVALDPGTTPSASVLRAMHPVSDSGSRLRIPSVDLDVPLGALTMVDHEITPPGFRSAYLVRNIGSSPEKAATGTVFVVMHSLRGGATGPGNYLIDIQAGTARVRHGAHIEVGSADYTVTGSRSIKKSALADDRSVWQDTPGRLVIVTCLQRPGGGASVDNVVITARLTTPDAHRAG